MPHTPKACVDSMQLGKITVTTLSSASLFSDEEYGLRLTER